MALPTTRRPYLAAAVLAAGGLGLSLLGQEPLARAMGLFGSEPLPADRVIALAQPLPGQRWNLLLLEQLRADAPCWQQQGDGTALITPTTISDPRRCGRFSSSSSFTLRVANNDLNSPWRLRLEAGNGELRLLGLSPQAPAPLLVARAPEARSASADRPLALTLEPGWRLERRSYEGRPLSHLYLSNPEALPLLLARASGAGNGRLAVLPPPPPPIGGAAGVEPGRGRLRDRLFGRSPLAGTTPTSPGAERTSLSEVVALQVIPFRE